MLLLGFACVAVFGLLAANASDLLMDDSGDFEAAAGILVLAGISGFITWGCSSSLDIGFTLYIIAALVALSFVNKVADRKIRENKRNNITFTPQQQKQLDDAKWADENAMADYELDYTLAKNRYAQDIEQRAVQIKQELVKWSNKLKDAAEELKAEIAKLDQMDVLGEDEKTLKTVDLLISFISSRRADNVKEALHEYDKLMANEQLLAVEQQRLKAELERVAVEKQRAAEQQRANARAQKEMENHNMMMRVYEHEAARRTAEMSRQLEHIAYMVHYDTFWD